MNRRKFAKVALGSSLLAAGLGGLLFKRETTGSVFLIKARPEDVLGVVRRDSLEGLDDKAKTAAGYFDVKTRIPIGKTIANFKKDKTTMPGENPLRPGIGVRVEPGMKHLAFLARPEGDAFRDFDGSLVAQKNVKHFVQGWPALVQNGKTVVGTGGETMRPKFMWAARTVAGVNDNNEFLVLVINKRVTFQQAARMAIKAGFKHAVNLDGGKSTHLEVNGETKIKARYGTLPAYLVFDEIQELRALE